MQLYIDSDAAYLVLPKARSRGVRHFYLSSTLNNMQTIPTPASNGPILTECQTLKNVMSSAAEAEVGTVFLNGKATIPIVENNTFVRIKTNYGRQGPPTTK